MAELAEAVAKLEPASSSSTKKTSGSRGIKVEDVDVAAEKEQLTPPENPGCVLGLVAENSETWEKRVALTPKTVAELTKLNFKTVMCSGAGASAGFPDALYVEAGAEVVGSRGEVFGACQILVTVTPPKEMKEGEGLEA